MQLALTALGLASVDRKLVDASKLAQLFNLRSTAATARLLAPLVERHGLDLTECLTKLGLSERARDDLELNGPAWHFPLHGRPAALMVAKALLALHPPDSMRGFLRGTYDVVDVAAAALDAPQLDDPGRIELARLICSRSDAGRIADTIDRHFQAPEVRRELALAVARNSNSRELRKLGDLAKNLKEVLLEQVAYRLREWPENANRLSTKEMADGLGFGSVRSDLTPPDLMDVYAHAVRAAGRLDEGAAVSWSRLRHAIFRAFSSYSDGDACYRAGLRDETETRAARSLDLRTPFIEMMANAAAVEDQDLREELYEWILSTAFKLGPQQSTTMERLAPVLASLHGARPAELRTELAGALTDAVHIAGASAVIDFIHSGQFHRRHMHAFAAVLARLYTPDRAALPASLQKVLSHSKLKDGRRWQSVTRDLVTIVGSGGLSRPERRRLIELSAPMGQPGSAAVTEFMKKIKLLAMFAQAIETETVDSAASRSALGEASSAAALDEVLDRIARRATPGSASNRESDDPAIQANWLRFMTDSRNPEALLSYAQAVKTQISLGAEDSQLDDDRQADLIATIDLYADAIVWSSNKAQAFAALRYDTAASVHLAHIAEHSPDAWAAWRTEAKAQKIDDSHQGLRREVDISSYLYQRIIEDQHIPVEAYPTVRNVLQGTLEAGDALHRAAPESDEHRLLQLLDPAMDTRQRSRIVQSLIARMPDDPRLDQFRRDLEDLKTLLTARPAVVSGLRVIDTDHAEDLLLSGTEVIGSCQHVSGQLHLNKALMGYVVDGKYRMLAAKGEDGRIAARRMLRLLLDEEGKPALHVERLYANPGIQEGDAVDQAFMQLAKTKAEAMGCRLFADGGNEDETQALYSGDSRAPFEYVDANAGVMEREYEIEATLVE